MTKPLIVFLIAFSFVFLSSPVYGQIKGVEMASVYDLADTEAQEGDILVNGDQGLVRANVSFDSRIFGVVQNEVVAVYRDVEKTGVPVLRNGNATVRVSTLNGEIKRGDYITSSEITGLGAKADRSGYVLGTAVTDFVPEGSQTEYRGNQYQVGTVTVALQIEFADITYARNPSRLINQLNEALLRSLQSPDRAGQIIRYIMALLILFSALAVAYVANTRATARSIEAIGRNPVAKREIQASARLSFFFSGLIVIVGIIAAILIIIL